MTVRLWYPQLDVYDTIRRIGGLLASWKSKSPSKERIYIADFYLANPALLHLTQMQRDVRAQFRDLGIERPEKAFLSYPAAPILFQKMEPVQKQAMQTLTAKGLVNLEELERGRVVASDAGSELFAERLMELFVDSENHLLEFLVDHFVYMRGDDIAALRKSTGLRRWSR